MVNMASQNGPSHLGKIHDRNNPCQYGMTNINQYQRKSYGQYGIAHIDQITHTRETKTPHQTKMGHPI